MRAVITTENDAATLRPVDLPATSVQRARAAAVEEAGAASAVGAFVDAVAVDDVATIASFEAELAGYRGWRWSVTLAKVADDPVTISEVVMLPGPDALLAPEWVPWEQRVRPEDLGPGDLLPTAPDDERLVPAYLQSDDPAVEELAIELGLGRVRVMGREGREAIAEAWHDGPFGPDSEMAKQAPGHCVSCAFYLPLAGSLGAMFGACGNEFGPAGGRVVDLGFGCGAHSEAAAAVLHPIDIPDAVIDELLMDVHARPRGATTLAADPVAGAPDNTFAEITAAALAVITDLDPLIRALTAGPQPVAALDPAPVLAALEAGPAEHPAADPTADRASGQTSDQASDLG
ncbi:DUF3027 domain-containing protein [Nakamurella lactea]|uniref:DUF3027 domain-containing protein n=1 Tax=Nakamurella lactea TaxID=459515 RepID=UPI001B7FD6C8|nr:DUF3027 domain-containing protein [Nakamurella lactea]